MLVARVAAVLWMAAAAAGCGDNLRDDRRDVEPSTLFVVDRTGDSILRYDGTTGELLGVFAAGADARIDRPSSVRLGPNGLLYLAGFGRGEIIRYDAYTGALADVFYWDTRLLEEPVELLFGGDDLVVLGNDTRNAVVIAPDGSAVNSFGPPDMRSAHDVVIGPDGHLYVTTVSHPELGSAVQVWDLATGTLLRHFGSYAELAAATGATLGPDGLLYLCDYERDQVLRYDPLTGALIDVLVPPGAGLLDPLSLDFGPDGALHVLDATGIHRVDPATGELLELLVAIGDGHLEGPRSFTFVTDAALAAAARR